MAYKVTHTVWLVRESERVKTILLMPRYWRRAWTVRSLHAALAEIGLTYTLPEVQELNDELHAQGILEDIPDSLPDPSPAPEP